MAKSVAIVHPWMPQYRIKFFTSLREELAARDIELYVYFGDTPPEWAQRNDSAICDSAIRLPTRFYPVGGRNLSYKEIRLLTRQGEVDLLILEQAIRNLETYRLIFSRRLYRKLAFWGHGRTYTVGKSLFEEWLKYRLTARADWFFAYTAGGADAVAKRGFPVGNTTVVQNSIDAVELRRSLAETTEEDSAWFRDKYDLTSNTFIYIGGVDDSKRITFLLDVAKDVHACDRSFRLIVVGDGPQARAVTELSRREPWLVYLGGLFGADKARALTSASAILNPGRVGLIAVDSLVAGRPIITTEWPHHAPEFEYLRHGETAIVTPDEKMVYRDAILNVMSDPSVIVGLSRNCLAESAKYDARVMAARFADGVEEAIETERPRDGVVRKMRRWLLRCDRRRKSGVA